MTTAKNVLKIWQIPRLAISEGGGANRMRERLRERRARAIKKLELYQNSDDKKAGEAPKR